MVMRMMISANIKAIKVMTKSTLICLLAFRKKSTGE